VEGFSEVFLFMGNSDNRNVRADQSTNSREIANQFVIISGKRIDLMVLNLNLDNFDNINNSLGNNLKEWDLGKLAISFFSLISKDSNNDS